ncbi:Protein lin-54 [Gossypium arboreum]|uniref:Protein lin-54 n=2 Tax=Gossypium arboreum TaxID=29729 RepID=A0A0B0PC75_GOSAR|nr:Protein lin-54 [Gossypium arboreum]
MLEFSSKNIWEHVESDEFMEHVRQGLDSQPTSLGGNQAMSIQLPSHILPLNHDPLISPAGRVRNRETFPDETEACKHCNRRRSRCLKLYCECFAAGIYCEDCCACENCLNKPDYEEGDGNLMNTPSARHKRRCKCKRSKCLKKYCECYRAKVGCSDGCHCEDCDNSFGKKSESTFQRVEKQQNQSHEMLNAAQVMSDSILVGTANLFLSMWEKLADKNHLTVSAHPHSRIHNMRDCQNVSQAESEKGASLHCYSSALSPKQPCRSKEIDDICEIMVDDFPDYHMETSNPIDTVKSGLGLGLFNGE